MTTALYLATIGLGVLVERAVVYLADQHQTTRERRLRVLRDMGRAA